MKEIVYSNLRKNLKTVIDDVIESEKPIKVSRRDYDNSVVILGEKQYNKMMERKNGKSQKR